jgi:hypothetical protein
MTEILTESFCERCGTRYTFESAKPRVRLKGVKTLSRGLKNFVLSDDTSIDEAMAAARSEADRETSSHQLDAFHKTFNFCMSCRQYTCPNCWNDAEARCLSCAPLALPEQPAELDDVAALRSALLADAPAPSNGTADQPEGARHEHVHVAEDTDAATEVAGTVETEADAEAELLARIEAEDAPLTGPAAADKAAAQTTGLLRRFRPGQSLDAELEAYERELQDATAEVAPAGHEATTATEPATVEAKPDPILAEATDFEAAEPEPEPVAAAVEPEPEAAATTQAIDAEPEPEPLAATIASDVVEQPTWRITAPDATGPAAPARPTEPDAGVSIQASATPDTETTGEPQWPARPQWPAPSSAAGLPFLGRPPTPQGGIDALWAASNQEIVAAPPVPGRTTSGIQPCINCGLSLSATARFCRRCGSVQTR